MTNTLNNVNSLSPESHAVSESGVGYPFRRRWRNASLFLQVQLLLAAFALVASANNNRVKILTMLPQSPSVKG